MKLEEILENPRTGEVRVVFRLTPPDTFVVVKFFDPVQRERRTMKVFEGMYQAVRSHWRTLQPMIEPQQRQVMELEARIAVRSLYNLLK